MSEQNKLMSQSESIHSISEILQKMTEERMSDLEEKAANTKSLVVAFSILKTSDKEDVYTTIFNRIQSGEISGDADDFHNVAVNYARHQQPERASDICQTGIRIWPESIDLNADALTYMLDAGDFLTAGKLAENLQKNCPDHSKWNWRGFSFLIEYYFKVQPKEYETAIDTLIQEYKKYLPQEEKAYICDADRYKNAGQIDKAISSLEDAISKLNAPQCALRLADIYFERAKYEDTIRVATLGIAYAAEPQPSVRTAYLIFLRALSKDALYLKNGCAAQEDAKQILAEYELAKKYVSSEEREIINLRMDILATYSQVNIPTES